MDQDLVIQFAINQIKKTQQKADKILKGDKSEASIESFFKESSELKTFIHDRIPSEEVNQFVKAIPDRDYKKNSLKTWQYFFSPDQWLALYKKYNTKNKIVEDIRSIKHQYDNLELMMKGLTG